MGSSRSRGSKGSKRSKGSSKKVRNPYSPNDPRMKKLMEFASEKPKYMHSNPLWSRIGNPFQKGGTRKNKYGGYVSAPLRKTSKNRSRRNNSRVGGYVYGGNLGLHHFYPYNTNVMTPPVIAGGKKTRPNRMVKGGSVLLGAPFTQGNVSSFGTTQGLHQTSEILFGNE